MGSFLNLTILYIIRKARYSRMESLRSQPNCFLYGVIHVSRLRLKIYLTPAFASLCKRVLRVDKASCRDHCAIFQVR